MYAVPDLFRTGLALPRVMSPLAAAEAYVESPIVSFDHPTVKKSYQEFTLLISIQYAKLINSGLQVEYVNGEPYASSAEMHAHVATGHIRTRATGDDLATPGHPMLQFSPNDVLINDMFRTVHDVIGHYATRSGFGPDGETVAWLEHRSTMYPIMHLALWLETRGQTAWTNWAGDHSALPLKDRPYADGLPRLISQDLT